MRERHELLEEVRAVLRGPCGVTVKVTESSRLMEDLNLDSVAMLSLVVGLENRLRIKLEEDPESPPETVAQILDLIQERLK